MGRLIARRAAQPADLAQVEGRHIAVIHLDQTCQHRVGRSLVFLHRTGQGAARQIHQAVQLRAELPPDAQGGQGDRLERQVQLAGAVQHASGGLAAQTQLSGQGRQAPGEGGWRGRGHDNATGSNSTASGWRTTRSGRMIGAAGC